METLPANTGASARFVHTTPLRIKLIDGATMPEYATSGAACFDIRALDNGMPHPNDDHACVYRTGLIFEVPEGYALMIYSRSGHGFKDALRLSNCVGVIDSDYRGEVKVSLRFDASGDRRCTKVRAGDRIAQAMLVPVPHVTMVQVDELSQTERGAGGFGSTGAA